MALMKISEYRQTYFTPGSRPSINTIKSWIKKEKVYGGMIEGKYYVDPEVIVPVNPLLEKVLLTGPNPYFIKRKQNWNASL